MTTDRLFGRKMGRRAFIEAAGGLGAGLLANSALAKNCGTFEALGQAETKGQGSFNWLTWNDHFLPQQIEEASTKYGIFAKPTLFSDNSEALFKVQQTGGKQTDMVSADALWAVQYHKLGLIEPIDLWSLDSARDLFDIGLDIPFWRTEDGRSMAYPVAWSPYVIAYNPKYVDPAPTSWEVLWDPKYRGKIAMELQPFDVMAFIGKSMGIDKAYDMNKDQIASAKQRLVELLPNILKFVEQASEVTTLMADESIWMATVFLGIEDRVKQAGGPEVKTFVPKEGTVGWVDGEMIVKDAQNRDVALAFLDKMFTGEWWAQNFQSFTRPLLNRKAYHLLVKQGKGDMAKRYLFDQPELLLQATLKGPSENMQDTIKAFNEALATTG
jgi:spermidine/putrescine-binding protein